MSDLAAAAAKLGVPEAILKRSADARAKATGLSVDELLSAWAGGAAAPAAAPAPDTSSQAPVPSSQAPVPSPQAPVPSSQAPVPSPQAPVPSPPAPATGPQEPITTPETGDRRLVTGGSPPVLVGRKERMALTITGSVGLMVLSVMLAVFLPSLPQPETGVRSSNHAFSRAALAGRGVYLEEGCGSCHTQLVRNVVPDAKIGPVTLDDTNQVIGYRRIGPDLSVIGSRINDTEALTALLAGEGNHPATALTDSELANLLSYLRESR